MLIPMRTAADIIILRPVAVVSIFFLLLRLLNQARRLRTTVEAKLRTGVCFAGTVVTAGEQARKSVLRFGCVKAGVAGGCVALAI